MKALNLGIFVVFQGRLNTILKFKEYMFNKLITLENVSLYDFQIAKEITHNLNNYKDLTHYSQNISFWIIDQISNGAFLVTTDKKSQRLLELREQANQYKIIF